MYLPVANTPPGAVAWGGWSPRGMGDAAQTVGTVSSLGTPILTGALAASAASTAAATGAPAVILGMAPSLAIPVIGAALVGVTIAAVYLIRNSGCGQTCIVTSQWANEAEKLLKQNLEAYMALPTPRPRSAWNTAQSTFHVIWARLEQMCGDPSTGDAGKRCISDRQRGSCKWRDSSGQCFNWFVGYLDPIANDPNVAPDSVASSASDAVNSVVAAAQASPSTALLLLAGAGLLIWGLS